jgi:hypothetical protein
MKNKINKTDLYYNKEINENFALAHLLINEIIFINSYWFKEEWNETDKTIIAICVNCSDIFAWGCADAEKLPHNEIQNLYEHWIKDPSWGSAVWCMKIRNELPQKPVYDMIMEEGIWDLDKMNLDKNKYDEYWRIHNLQQSSI